MIYFQRINEDRLAALEQKEKEIERLEKIVQVKCFYIKKIRRYAIK